jgi:anti-anti-sigma regulatory factor
LIRITHAAESGSSATLKVEGTVCADDVELLERECRRLCRRRRTVVLDFSGVSYADHAGLSAIRRLRNGGLALTGFSIFIEGLLQEKGDER